MANEFLSIKSIARLALPRLIGNLVFPQLIYRDFSDTAEAGKGATVQVRRPVTLRATDFDASSGTVAADVREQSVEVTLDRLATVDAEFSALSRATDADDLDRLFIAPAAAALAEKINDDGLGLYRDIPYAVGTAGTVPQSLAAFADAAESLDKRKVPTTERRGVWSADALAKFRQIGDIVNAEKCGSTEGLRAGSIGRIFGIDNYMAQGVRAHATGLTAATAVKVNGAVSAGATQFSIDGTALTGKLLRGDLLVIDSKQYVVTEDTAAAVSNAIATVKVYPALPALADNAAVTPVGNHTANLVFHPNAFAFVTRPLAAPAGVESYTTSYGGVTLRVVRGYDMKYKTEKISMDVLYGYKTLYPELAVRVLG